MFAFFNKIKTKVITFAKAFAETKVGSVIVKIAKRIQSNSEKYRVTNALLLLFFPLFIVSISEMNQMKSVSKFIIFVAEKPTIMLFNLLLASLIFWALVFLFKRGSIASLAMGITYFALSTAELFKFNTSGNHLILTDMKMTTNLKSLKTFAYIKITPFLITCAVLILIYVLACFWFNPKLKIKFLKRATTSIVCAATFLATFFIPAVAMPVYAFFDVDTTKADNVFKVNEKFDNNSFLAFFCETATENLDKKITVPANYNVQSIENYVEKSSTEKEQDWTKPNVIVIMSEAFTDFRRFSKLNIDDSYYRGYDAVAAESYKGTTIVPTFASFTVRTEFELNFGLPVKSLNDPNMPQRLLLNRAQPTIAQLYHDLGYNTNYIHTFTRSFYSRGRVYANFGFDNMYFEDNLTVPTEYAGSYISDTTIFNQIVKILNDNKDQPTFIHTTTMQDHQPYDEEGKTEIQAYLERVQNMTDNLKLFTEELKKVDRPTVVLFVGDHLPCFKGENNVYSQLELTGENCGDVYEQPYLIWSNYNMDKSKIPQDKFSAFYLPYVMLDSIGAPEDSFVTTMLDKMKTVPVYSTTYDNTVPNDNELDMLTYDRIFGKKLSDNTTSTEIDQIKAAQKAIEQKEGEKD